MDALPVILGVLWGLTVALLGSALRRALRAKDRAEEGLRRGLEERDQRAMQGTAELVEASTRQLEAYSRSVAELERQVVERTLQVEAANKELEAFAYSASHDLRAPLERVNDFSRALEEEYAERLDDQGRDYLRRIRGATVRMGQLIDALLRLSRLTRQEMHRVPVDLTRIAEEVADGLRASAPGRAVTFRIAAGLVAQGDVALMRVVLENLLGNAWKFTSKRSEAVIEFGTLGASDGETPWAAHQTIYVVRDNGVGFDMAYADKLFGAFQRLHGEAEFPGTGIGLATVQRIIHRHGGQVWAEAVPGEGATFYFTV